MKKLFSLLFAFTVILSCVCSAQAVTASDFTDISPGDWYYNAVGFVISKEMFNGTSSTTFSPDMTMTRGMFVTVLGRYGGASDETIDGDTGIITKEAVNVRNGPSVTGTTVIACVNKGTQLIVKSTVDDANDPNYTWYEVDYNNASAYIRCDMMEIRENEFSDVDPDKYYAPYVTWACSNDIAYTVNGTFRPEEPITREDICYMLYKFAALKHLQLEPLASVSSFTDSANISSNCKTPVSVLQQLGVVNGYTDGSFRPQSGGTRAQVSTMLMRFIRAVSYKPVTESSFDQYGNYIFGTETPASSTVNTDYFNDACFIGHSITVGMHSYLGLDNADFYAVNGASCPYFLNTYSGFELSTTHTDEEGNIVHDTGKLSQALAEHSYGKVYIMLGTNEIAAGDRYLQAFNNNLASIVDLVRSTQPNATIYLFAVTPVTQSCSETRDGLNRDNIIDYNAVIKKICAEKRCYYLNVFDLLVNEDGFLPKDEALSDGIHILSPQYTNIKSYIFTHAV